MDSAVRVRTEIVNAIVGSTGYVPSTMTMNAIMDAVRPELERLGGQLAKVEALPREWERDTCNVECSHPRCVTIHELVIDLDTALASVPEPSDSEADIARDDPYASPSRKAGDDA